MAGRGSDFDNIRFYRDFRRLSETVDRLVAATGITPITSTASSVRCYTLDAPGPVTEAGTDGTYSFDAGISIPANTLAVGQRLSIDFAFLCLPQNFPWSFGLAIHNGSDMHPVCDVETIDPTPTPTAAGMVGSARAVYTVRGTPGAIELVPDAFCAWAFPGGSTNRWNGVSANSTFAGLVGFSELPEFVIEPKITLTGATVGDTIQLLTLTALLTDRSASPGS